MAKHDYSPGQTAENGRVICHDPATMRNTKGEPRPFWQDKTGCWHYGPKMTEDAKRKAGWIE